MKAIFITKHGNSAVLALQEAEKPVNGNDQILIRVQAIGINYADILVREGVYPAGPLPAIAPGEVTGVIESVGTNVYHLQTGQQVMGVAQAGYAEFAVLDAASVFVLPAGLQPATGLLFQSLTACHLLNQTTGYNSVVITGAAGGVGSALVQIAKARGISTVIGMTGSKEKNDHVLQLGADHAISYQDTDWPAQLQQATSGHGADLILDAVGGETCMALINHLSINATMVVYGNSSLQPTTINPQDLIWKSNKLIGATIYAATTAQKQTWLDELLALIKKGALQQHHAVYSLQQVPEAQNDIQERRISGRAVIVL